MRPTVTHGLILLALLFTPGLGSATEPPIPALDRAGYDALLSDHRGQVVVVTFWATWCKPCRYEIPGLNRLHQKYASADVAVVAVSVDNDLGRLQHFVAKEGLDYPVYQGDLALKRDLGAFMIPLTLVYAPGGELAARHVGYLPPAQLEDEVRLQLAGAGSPEPAGALAQGPVGGERPR